MSIEEKRRAKFEAWYSSLPWPLCERCDSKDKAWQAWNAAMDSIEIELPPAITTLAGPVFYAIDVRATIEAAGLKVKP